MPKAEIRNTPPNPLKQKDKKRQALCNIYRSVDAPTAHLAAILQNPETRWMFRISCNRGP